PCYQFPITMHEDKHMLSERQYGTVYPDGVVTEPELSALSGRRLEPGDVTIQIGAYRIGVTATEWRRLTPDQQAILRADWEHQLPAAAPEAQDVVDYNAMTLDELKAHAGERGVDLTGRRSKESVVQ